jgi:hypothetical protein
LRGFPGHGKFASVRNGAGAFDRRNGLRADEGENRIRGPTQSLPARLLLLVCLILSLPVVAAACGGGEETEPPPTVQDVAEEEAAEPPTVAVEEATSEGEPFTLVVDGQAVPPDFRAAYERESPMVVQFFKQDEMAFYPQGLGVDSIVDDSLGQLQEQYPDVEFFSYDIDDPGLAENSAELELGQYGTLATQLGVQMTPYVAMLAPREGGYVYESVFVGYSTQPVLDQALAHLADTRTSGSEGFPELVLQQVEPAGGGEIKSVTVGNEGEASVELGGYELVAIEPSTGEAAPDSGSLTVDGEPEVDASGNISLGVAPDVEDAEGNQVDGTFGGGPLAVEPGDQVGLVTPDGAVAATFTL